MLLFSGCSSVSGYDEDILVLRYMSKYLGEVCYNVCKLLFEGSVSSKRVYVYVYVDIYRKWNERNVENVNYCKQLIALDEECNVYFFNFSFGMIRIFQIKKKMSKEMIRERKRTGREKLQTVKSYKFSFKGSGKVKLRVGERRKGYGVTSVFFWLGYITADLLDWW